MSSTLPITPSVAVTEQQRHAYLDFARDAVKSAAPAILSYFRSPLQVENKAGESGFDPVTLADREAEQSIREAINGRFPEHGIFGEEFGYQEGNGLTWVIDPIDGTRAFMMGQLHWGSLLALYDGEKPIVGVMYQPFTDELFSGDGSAAWYEQGSVQRPLATSNCKSLDRASLACTGTAWFSEQQRSKFKALSAATRLTKFGGDCYLFGLLAMGHTDLGVEAGLNPYDIQALIPIIEGAGGCVSTWEGGNPALGGQVVAASTPDLHDQAMAALNSG